jgi:dinuclear metal center YbgI/SA1388 family protein
MTSITFKQVTEALAQWAPPLYQEDYDNAGLMVGHPATVVKGILLTLDITTQVIDEALLKGCNLIVAHHPIVFKGLKKLNGSNYVEEVVIKAIQNNVGLYAIHTNLDNMLHGVNAKIAEKIGLEQVRILSPKTNTLCKLTTFVPLDYTQQVLKALGEAGAGQIGAYQHCSFRTEGTGTFQPLAQANPFIGQAGGALEEVRENRLEVIFPRHLEHQVMQALRQAHPYEEIAYYLYHLANANQEIGSGAIGELPEAMPIHDFFAHLKTTMRAQVIRHTAEVKAKVKTIALCGGSGSFLLREAIRQKADVYVSADFKYHEFFDADGKIIIADIGHYESEQFTAELIRAYLIQHFANLPLALSDIDTNPIRYWT